MNDNFDRAFEYVLKNEGGFSNNPHDSGGATKYGITQGTLAHFRGAPVSVKDVADLSRDEAKAIYRAWYWDLLRLDEVQKLVVATVLFDAAVLFGAVVAATHAQRVLVTAGFALTVDGKIGPRTLAALNNMDQALFVVGFQSQLRQRVDVIIRAHPTNEVFRNGWANRLDRFTSLIA